MKDSSGDSNFPIWLIADSEPQKWQSKLDLPLDPRHPARHNIWTPVLYYLQDYLYRNGKLRLDTENLYITNAVKNPECKPKGTDLQWSKELQNRIKKLRTNLSNAKPNILLSFGAFAFEILRRTHGEEPKKYIHWGTRELGTEFRKRVNEYDSSQINIIPLLHVSIARGRFLESHKYFVGEEKGNYFKFVGIELAELFLERLATKPIWIR